MILETTKNQYGESCPTKEVYFFQNNWFLEEINCYSSLSLGMGTCRCVSHPTYFTSQISREEVILYVGENIVNLSDEEMNDLQKNSFEDQILEKLSLKGFDLQDVEKWCLDCYNLGMNPLPTLRKLLNCKVEFNYATSGQNIPDEYEENIIFVMVKKLDEEIEDVWFEIVPKR